MASINRELISSPANQPMAGNRDLLKYDSLRDPYLRQFLSAPKQFDHLRANAFVSDDGEIHSERQQRLLIAQAQASEMAKSNLAEKLTQVVIEKRKQEEDRAFRKMQEERRQEQILDIKLSRKVNLSTFVRQSVVESLETIQSHKPVELDLHTISRVVRHEKSSITTMASISTKSKKHNSASSTRGERPLTQNSAFGLSRSELTKRQTTAHQPPLLIMQYFGRQGRLKGPATTDQIHIIVQQQYDGSGSKPVFDGRIRLGDEFQFYSLRKQTSPLGLSVCFL